MTRAVWPPASRPGDQRQQRDPPALTNLTLISDNAKVNGNDGSLNVNSVESRRKSSEDEIAGNAMIEEINATGAGMIKLTLGSTMAGTGTGTLVLAVSATGGAAIMDAADDLARY